MSDFRSHESLELKYGNQPLSAKALAKSLLPKLSLEPDGMKELLLWPPNLFAFTSLIMSVTGAYHLVCSPPSLPLSDRNGGPWPPEKDWAQNMNDIGVQWRVNLTNRFKETREIEKNEWKELFDEIDDLEGEHRSRRVKKEVNELVPSDLLKRWDYFYDGMDEGDISDLLCPEKGLSDEKRMKLWEHVSCLVSMHAIADEACIGWGIREFVSVIPAEEKKSEAQKFSEELLRRKGTLATIHPQRGRVLPKRHTPNVGITLRSVSTNLAFHRSSVDVKWRTSKPCPLTEKGDISSLSVLLIPWPIKIHAIDFREKKVRVHSHPERFAYFEYNPGGSRDDELLTLLPQLLKTAREEVGRVDMVVLPEEAISDDLLERFEKVLEDYGVSIYVAGVREIREPEIKGEEIGENGEVESVEETRFNRNLVYCKVATEKKKGKFEFPKGYEYQHGKHHRWRLSGSQITQYQLGGILSLKKDWWEATKINPRQVSFINVGNELTICPLICEDLARQDPIADLIRTAGPSLVVAILMDGPQLTNRWSARYANVLTDDPGSSVITLTSYGMVERWQVPWCGTSRVVALWSDPYSVLNREIQLEEGAKGILLSLSVLEKKEPSLDGRTETVQTPYLTLGGVRQIRLV